MKDVMDMAIDAETRGVVLNASVLGGFPQSDIPHLSCSAIVVCDGSHALRLPQAPPPALSLRAAVAYACAFCGPAPAGSGPSC